MKLNLPVSRTGNQKNILVAPILLFLLFAQFCTVAQTANAPLRRPVSTSSPMYLMHIDTWNYADPQKIIDLIPADIRPYVVMNIALSISHDVSPSRFKIAEYGYEITKSWLRVCAENRMWAMVQVASGGMAQFSETDLTVYEELYKNYPNLIGFNYAEQFWGYDEAGDVVSAGWTDRIDHFADLLKLSNKYGAYLVVSWCGNQYSPNINPIGMLKRNSAFSAACRQYTKNYILCEKYTTVSYQHDMESLCLGAYLSGLSGNYGIRYDDTGWTDSTGTHTSSSFTMGTAAAPILEHMMLTGQTVVDGPELIWTQCFQETGAISTTNGYSTRNWQTFSQFDNVSVDLFRKVLDGSVRIPTRQEVIDRTKVAIINNVNSGSNDDIYSSPETLFDGLYRMDSSGTYQNNKNFFKKSGRYPAIPTVYQLADAAANSFPVKVNKSDYSTRWPTTAAKVNEFNSLFPAEYTGDIYAGRHENGWVVYNPYKTVQTATGRIPFKYNTADSMELTLSQYTAGVIKETANQLKIYLNNYDNVINTGLKTDVIKIYGSTSQPTWSYTDRASHQASSLTATWSDGVFTLTIQHNGPLDITINCSGTASGRLTSYNPATLAAPDRPAAYAGPRQYEAEIFDYKSIGSIVTSGYSGSIRNYTGQGYIQFGANAGAAVRKTVNVLQPGTYQLQARYVVTGGNVTTIDLYVNGVKVSTPVFTVTPTTSDWNINTQPVSLQAGANTVEFRANAAAANTLYFDNIVVLPSTVDKYDFENDIPGTGATNPAALVTTLQSGTAGVVTYTGAASHTTRAFRAYSNGAVNGTGVLDLDMFAGTNNYSIAWKEFAGTAGGKKGVLLHGTGSSAYATGMKQGYLFVTENNTNNTVTLRPYIVNASGISAQSTYTSSFTVAANTPTWYRATASGNTLTFECSSDSINWEGGTTATFTDYTYPGGTTQILWGFGNSNFSWVMDDITYYAPRLSANVNALDGFSYVEGNGPSASKTITVNGQSLKADVPVVAPANYEISLNEASGYASSITLVRVADSIPATTLYVRLKTGLLTNTYKGSLTIGDNDNTIKVALSGVVTLVKVYTFTNDVASTSAQTPPAADITVAPSNGATAGVVSYTDSNGNTSNYLKAYSGGVRNATAALNLDMFPSNAPDYAVTWKQVIAAPGTGKEYKNGVLLRGTEPAGTATTGYVQGLKQGYLFIVYNPGTANAQFRIYKSTTATGLSTLVNSSPATLVPAANQPLWYRASVSGTSPASLKLEYSTDSITWNTGAQTTDAASPSYTSGATQFVWGLAAASYDFYVDNITLASTPSPADITLSQNLLTGYTYQEGGGPSASQSFAISGVELTDNIMVTAPGTFEISLNADSGYAATLTLPHSSDTLASTTIYARMKSGLAAGSYEGNITFSYAGQPGESEFDKPVTVKGLVVNPTIVAVAADPLTDLDYIAGGQSVVRSFIVSGTNLSENLEITAPANFEISLSRDSGYAASLALAPVSDSVTPAVIYIRMVSGLSAGSYSGTLAVASTGAESKSLAVGGSVLAQAIVNVSETSLSGFGYSTFSNSPPVKSFVVWGHPLSGDITITAPANFEISRASISDYGSAFTLPVSNGKVDSTIVFIRLKEDLPENSYHGDVVITSSSATTRLIAVSGTVSSNRIYDFTGDVPSSAAQTPPAAAITAGTGNSATAGVVSYTDASSGTSNRFRAYSGGSRNSTGAMNLDLFPGDATDYSVTWKQSVGSNADYKVGVLLRGNTPEGTATTGYVQGIKQGYLFIVYTAKGAATPYTQFRIYSSTAATNLPAYVNNQVNGLNPAIGQNMWYRASVKGSNPVNLKFEYSTDSTSWVTAATATEASATPFLSGSTQLVWGLGSPNFNFFLDDITYRSLVPVAQTVVLEPIPAKMVGDTAFRLLATASSGRPIVFSSSDTTVVKVVSDWAHILKKGTTTIVATQTGDDVLIPASDSALLIVYGKPQQVSFDSISPKLIGDTAFALVATASSGLPVSFTNSDTTIAKIVDGYVHMLTPGTVTISAIQAGNDEYAADTVNRALVINSLGITLSYTDGDGGNVSNNTIRPYFKIVNNSASAVALPQLTVRYWLTPENFTGVINGWIDYAQMGDSKVTMQYVAASPVRLGALGYMQYSFTTAAGNLSAAANTGVIQTRFANSDWSMLDETDDYSRLAASDYIANAKITVYRNGVLVWGTEPTVAASALVVKALTQSKSAADNTISTTLQLKNEGNQAVAYSDIKVRYWFTSEGSAALNYWVDYAKIGNSKVSAQFVTLPATADSADTYIEFSFSPALGYLYPLAGTGDINYRIARNDWSNFNQLNDFSYRLPAALAENARVTVYYQGNLVWGTEPVSSGSSAPIVSRLSSAEQETVSQKVYPNPARQMFYVLPGIAKEQLNGTLVIRLVNSSGHLVFVRTISGYAGGAIQINSPEPLVQGIYFVVINNNKPLKIEIK